jgi:hypothetical protein
VIAFDHGAVADRVRKRGGGFLVPPERGAEGVLERLLDLGEKGAFYRNGVDRAIPAVDLACLYQTLATARSEFSPRARP